MKFRVNRRELHQAIQNIIGVVPVKTTIPMLGNILLDLQGNQLTLTGTDLEVSISTKIEVQGGHDGAVAIPAKIVFEIVRELPDIPVDFSCDDSYKIELNTDRGFYRLSGEARDEFPKIAVGESQGGFDIDAQRFDNMVNKALFAVSIDELRTTLMGVYLKVMANELRLVSTDGHRLVKIVDTTFSSPGFEQEAIIPTKALILLSKNLNSNKKITVGLSDDHIVFTLANTTIFSKGIEGQFPNYERVIPIDNDKKVLMNRELLSSSVRRVSIFSNSITHQIRLSVSDGAVEIQSEDIEFGGEAREKIEADYSGESMDIGYNAVYLLDILKHLESDDIELTLKDPVSAGIIYPATQKQGEDVLMLLMPIRLNDE
ncbi:MAG: DNA polymerase III subunit beta [bacterium]